MAYNTITIDDSLEDSREDHLFGCERS